MKYIVINHFSDKDMFHIYKFISKYLHDLQYYRYSFVNFYISKIFDEIKNKENKNNENNENKEEIDEDEDENEDEDEDEENEAIYNKYKIKYYKDKRKRYNLKKR